MTSACTARAGRHDLSVIPSRSSPIGGLVSSSPFSVVDPLRDVDLWRNGRGGRSVENEQPEVCASSVNYDDVNISFFSYPT